MHSNGLKSACLHNLARSSECEESTGVRAAPCHPAIQWPRISIVKGDKVYALAAHPDSLGRLLSRRSCRRSLILVRTLGSTQYRSSGSIIPGRSILRSDGDLIWLAAGHPPGTVAQVFRPGHGLPLQKAPPLERRATHMQITCGL